MTISYRVPPQLLQVQSFVPLLSLSQPPPSPTLRLTLPLLLLPMLPRRLLQVQWPLQWLVLLLPSPLQPLTPPSLQQGIMHLATRVLQVWD